MSSYWSSGGQQRLQRVGGEVAGGWVATIWLESVAPVAKSDVLDASDPYVVMSVLGVEGSGAQTQRSSTRTNSTRARWAPAERFEFVLGSPQDRIVLSVYDEDAITSDDLLAQGVASMPGLGGPLLGTETTLEAFDARNNKPIPTKIVLRMRLDEARQTSHEQLVAEHQRYAPGRGWSAKCLTRFDPPPWLALGGGGPSGKSFEEAAPVALDDTEVAQDWHFATSPERTEGWEYAVNFTKAGNNYRDEKSPLTFVRRRVWCRVLARIAS